MKISDELLMAYADNELDAPQREAIEQAMQTDPSIAQAVARHKALRRDVFDAFAGVLDEPVPARLRPRADNVVPMSAVRERAQRRRWSWPEWGALAASLAIGVFAGGAGWQVLRDDASQVVLEQGGGATARGTLASALSNQLAAESSDGVRIGVSFVSTEGAYCRSFTVQRTAGLACRDTGDWRIAVLTETPAARDQQYRQASAQMPQAVLDAIDERIAGDALDAQGERAARDQRWAR
ncbi:anti-sigma factor family protein [Pseudoduganella lutea]|uniref:Anti-sigma factor n=1 Tax=Pseudoduganella lutea TaxID=321985 RepID=A0A4P6KUI2_9BURK|nr:hypothetical protein [Pseudoduganella lutea]QBE62072.1 hypothetical protein EWM63_02970 [Pseudoduganella lutea]